MTFTIDAFSRSTPQSAAQPKGPKAGKSEGRDASQRPSPHTLSDHVLVTTPREKDMGRSGALLKKARDDTWWREVAAVQTSTRHKLPIAHGARSEQPRHPPPVAERSGGAPCSQLYTSDSDSRTFGGVRTRLSSE